jgi:hypothetical protein
MKEDSKMSIAKFITILLCLVFSYVLQDSLWADDPLDYDNENYQNVLGTEILQFPDELRQAGSTTGLSRTDNVIYWNGLAARFVGYSGYEVVTRVEN